MKAVFAAVLSLLPAFSAHSATLAGDSIDAYVSAYGGRIYGFGLDRPFVVSDGTVDTKQYSNAFTLNVNGDGFNIQFLTYGQFSSSAAFTMSDLNFHSTAPVELSGLTIDTNIVGHTTDITPTAIRLNLGDVYINTDKYFRAKFVTSAVPEVSTLSLMAVGLLGVAVMFSRGNAASRTDRVNDKV